VLMKIRLSDLWRWDGECGRGLYVFWGCLLFFIKFQLDRLISFLLFQRDLDPWFYVAPWELASNIQAELIRAKHPDPDSEAILYILTMVTFSLPFIYVGVLLTLKRLRSAGLCQGLVSVFFFPVIHYLFFALMAVMPDKPEVEVENTLEIKPLPPESFWSRLIPKSLLGSAFLGGLLSAALAVIFCTLSVYFFKDYGWSLMVGVPFTVGLISVLLHGHHQRRSFFSCLLACWLATVLTGVALVAVRIEGLVCLIFLLPIALIFSTFGGIVAYFIQRQRHLNQMIESQNTFGSILMVLATLPLMMGAEHHIQLKAPLYSVTTKIVIDAPPETVWRHVVTFRQLPEPTEPWFKMGIAYPQRAIIYGKGVGAIRHCIFSTGPFIEPITIWDEPNLLKFSVAKQPPPMKEFSFFEDFKPPHLENYLVSKGGQFQLTTLSNNQTEVAGTTWYYHKAWPQRYWKLWSDAIIHNIHERVLKTIKEDAEADGNPTE
jgi:hypothetical protein